MFKSFGNLLYRTPWWLMAASGFAILVLLLLFAVPTQVLRLENTGSTPEEKRAIKREIDRAVGDSALNFAENIVRTMKNHASDQTNKQELDDALREIARSRKELSSAQHDVAKKATDANKQAMIEANETALEAAREAAETALQSARESREAVEETRQETADKLKSTGVDAKATLKALDDIIKSTREKEKAAKDALKKIGETRKKGISFGIDLDNGVTVKPSDASKSGMTISVDQDGVKKEINIVPPASPDAPVPPAVKGGKSNQHHFNIGVDSDGRAGINLPALPPEQPLPVEMRDTIHRQVDGAFRRVGIGSIALLAFIPLFVMLLVAKVLVGRSRRAQEFAEQKKKEAEVSNVNRQITEARLQALQAQVEPHFLYNTLANVQALTEVDPVQANQMTGHLIQYLRSSLPKMRENTSTVGQEIELVRAYLNILKMRMGTRLEFDIDCATELQTLSFPPMMLPSLVENAIKHGLEPQREGGRIDVVVSRVLTATGNRIRVAVKDTGRGLTDAPTQAGGGVGLSNIRERLIAIYGDAGRLTLESNDPKGVIATIEVPAETGSVAGAAAAGAAPAGRTVPPPPQGWWGRTRAAASATHGVWAKIVSVTFTTLMMAAAVLFGLLLAGLYTGVVPINVGDTPVGGVEGMALGTLVLVAAFAVVALAIVIVVAVLYGLGVMLAGLLLFIPLMILIASFPALAPFILVGLAIYWWVKRRRAGPGGPPR